MAGGLKGLVAGILSKLMLDGGVAPGQVYTQAGPVPGRDLLADGSSFLRSAFPRLSRLPSPPAGVNFATAGQASGINGIGDVRKCVTGAADGTMVLIFRGANPPRRWSAAGWASLNLGAYNNQYTHDALQVGSVWYLAGEYGVLRSTDNLATFTRVMVPTATYYQACALCVNPVTGAISCMEVNAYPYYGSYWQPRGDYVAYFRNSADGVTWAAGVNVTNFAFGGGYGYQYNSFLPAKFSMHVVDGFYCFFYSYDMADDQGGYYSWSSAVGRSATPSTGNSWSTFGLGEPLVGTLVYNGAIQVFYKEYGGYKAYRRAYYPKLHTVSSWTRYTQSNVYQIHGAVNNAMIAQLGTIVLGVDSGVGSSMMRENLDDETNTTNGTTFIPVANNAFSSNTYGVGAGPNGFVQFAYFNSNPNTAYDDYATYYAPYGVLPTVAAEGTGAKKYVRAR